MVYTAMHPHNPLYIAVHRKSQLSSLHHYKVVALTIVLGLVAGPFLAAYDIMNQSFVQICTLRQRKASLFRQPAWNARGSLETLPQRTSLDPSVTEKPPRPQSPAKRYSMHKAVSDYLFEIAQSRDQQCYLGRSSFIAGPTALFATARRYDGTHYHGQICSADLSAGNMHVSLHAADAKAVAEAGWGQLAQQNPLISWWEGLTSRDTESRIVMALPSNEDELEVTKKIIGAAAWWVGGTDSKVIDESLV